MLYARFEESEGDQPALPGGQRSGLPNEKQKNPLSPLVAVFLPLPLCGACPLRALWLFVFSINYFRKKNKKRRTYADRHLTGPKLPACSQPKMYSKKKPPVPPPKPALAHPEHLIPQRVSGSGSDTSKADSASAQAIN